MTNNRLVAEQIQWHGISSERLIAYRKLTTPAGNLCGTYAATVALCYFQDYLEETIIPEKLRQKDQAVTAELINKLRQAIQKLGLPTVPLQVAHGLNRFFKETASHHRAHATSIGSWTRVTKRINRGYPVLVSILKMKGSSYGNHWVLAYAYGENQRGQRFYKVHDNWGEYAAVIPAAWANGTVSIK